MSTQTSPKKPRLSLQIKALSAGPGIRASRTLAAVVNPSSPTAFNTLSNVYSTAIDRSTAMSPPVPLPQAIQATGARSSVHTVSDPVTAIPISSKKGMSGLPRLQMPDFQAIERHTQTPYMSTQFPETPLTVQPFSQSATKTALDAIQFPSTAIMTATPPLSAVLLDHNTNGSAFCFSPDGTTDQHDFFDTKRSTVGAFSLRSDSVGSSSVSSRSRSNSPDAIHTPIEANRGESSKMDQSYSTQKAGSSFVVGVKGKTLADDTSSTLKIQSTASSHQKPPFSVIPASSVSSHHCVAGVTTTRSLLNRLPAPYQHPRTLHSILRNSPLPPSGARSPTSQRRQSQRLLDKASRHVVYNSPLTQIITTNTYTRSHIDLLREEASPASGSPASPSPSQGSAQSGHTATLAYASDETRDGGTTPGPFEEVQRRMVDLGATGSVNFPGPPTPSLGVNAGGVSKRKQPRRDKKRCWVWTLGQDDEEEAEEHMSGAMAALKAAQVAEREVEGNKTAAKIQMDEHNSSQSIWLSDVIMQDRTSEAPAYASATTISEPTSIDKVNRKRKSTLVPYQVESDGCNNTGYLEVFSSTASKKDMLTSVNVGGNYSKSLS